MKKGLNKEQRYYLGILKANMNNHRGIFAAYKSPSQAKINAYHQIALECIERGGERVVVLTANTFSFTAGYFYPDADTGELRACIELPTRTLDFAVAE